MLIVLPSDAMTRSASDWLAEQNVTHELIALPESIDYKTGANTALYITGNNNMDVPMRLSKQRFVVMRVFREFSLPDA